MRISIAICTHNEPADYIQQLLTKCCHLVKAAPNNYEVVVVDDFSDNKETIHEIAKFGNYINFTSHALNNDFATHKNFMNSLCKGDWILNLDADEDISMDMLNNLPLFIESNPDVEAYWFPRINVVHGITLDLVRKWGWIITTFPDDIVLSTMNKESEEYELLKQYNLIVEEGDNWIKHYRPIINWADMQMRLYKNAQHIQWTGKVHERLTGFKHFSAFPTDPQYAISHIKDVTRQVAQNNYYETIQR